MRGILPSRNQPSDTYDVGVTDRVVSTLYLRDPEPAEPAEPAPDPLDRDGRLRRMRERLVVPMPADGYWGWLGPLLVALLAGALRFYRLGTPSGITLDETYYVKGGISLWQVGFERDAIENADKLLGQGNADVFKEAADYVVHPMFGKWVIGSGTEIFGINAFGWRFAVALLGTLAVFVTARAGRRLFRSTLLGCAAGLLLAVDGTALVMSRIGMLDGVIAALLIFAFACLLVDRDRSRALLADRMASVGMDDLGRWAGSGPSLGLRPWRIAAGVMLGLALGTKWSALYFIALFGILSLLWDAGARRSAGLKRPFLSAVKRDALPAFVSLVAVAIVVYLATWGGWFLTDGGWDRDWAAGRSTSFPFIPEAVRSLWHYHSSMYSFHSGLTSPHPYQSNAWGWLIQARPTAIYYSSATGCGAAQCTSAITSLGNPMLWWAGVLAIPYLAIEWLGRRDWRAAAILGCIAAGLLPWIIMYNGRTVFAFYTVVLSAFIALGVAYCLGRILGPVDATARRKAIGAAAVGGYLALALLFAAFFLPVWTADPISFAEWGRRMWFKSWV